MKNEKINIAIIYSPNWSEYIAIETYAIFKNVSAPVKVYLISDEDGNIDLSHLHREFGDGYETEFINASELYNKTITTTKNVDSRFTKYALYRLILPELIQDGQLLYIDADAIVNGDIRDLWETDISDFYVAGVIDIGADRYNLKRPIGLGANDTYINAGIMLMNLKKIREDKLQDKWVHEANTKHYAAHDQCIINKTAKGKIKLIHNRYNVSPSTGNQMLRADVKIAHFAGNIKPWSSSNVDHYPIWNRLAKEYKSKYESAGGR